MNRWHQVMRLALLSLAVFILWGLPVVQANSPSPMESPLAPPAQQPTVGVEPLDLSVDMDHDGMPDELVSALEELNAAYETARRAERGEQGLDRQAAQQALQAAEQRWFDRLPYNGQTRQALMRMANLPDALAKAPDAASVERLRAEQKELLAQMMQDPNFALVDHLLSWRLEQALNAKIVQPTDSDVAQPTEETPDTPDTEVAAASAETSASTPMAYLPALVGTTSAQVEADNGGVSSAAVQGGITGFVAAAWQLVERDPCSPKGGSPFDNLVRADLLFFAGNSKFNNFFYAKKYSHVGMYNGVTDGVARVYEANPDDGTNLRRLDNQWQNQRNACIAHAYVSLSGITHQKELDALDSAQAAYGTNGRTPYSYAFDQVTNTNAIYCSQLIWLIYMMHPAGSPINRDLDSDAAVYRDWARNRYALLGIFQGSATYLDNYLAAAVAPDEIVLHSSVTILAERQY